jgi:hypothetical protein
MASYLTPTHTYSSALPAILRPAQETETTIESRVSSLFFSDLIRHYHTIFPPLLEKKHNEVDRPMPIRKRTLPIDRRISRSQLEASDDPKGLLEQQMAIQRPPPSPQAAPKIIPVVQRVELRDEPMHEVAPIELSPVVESSPTLDHQRPMTPPSDRRLSNPMDTTDTEDQPQIGNTPARLARQHPVSKEQQDRPLSETESTLSRSGSGENSRLRGPRGKHALNWARLAANREPNAERLWDYRRKTTTACRKSDV